jgi:lipid II:glycine glycyltransferase (peptidoglycan interpeptide bridge formation enzyme)
MLEEYRDELQEELNEVKAEIERLEKASEEGKE